MKGTILGKTVAMIKKGIGYFHTLYNHKGCVDTAPLRIDGIGEAPLTPEPDDAERAAAAVLGGGTEKGPILDPNALHDSHYYDMVADRVREAKAMEERVVTRWVAWCEDRIKRLTPSPSLSKRGDDGKDEKVLGELVTLERGLYERMDVVNRVGGELKKRWQHCLAEVTVMMYNIREGES